MVTYKNHKLLIFYLLPIAIIINISSNCASHKDDSGWPLPFFEKGCNILMNSLHQEWKRTDGELTFIVARKMIWAMLLDPNSFYAEFSPDTTNYERFSTRIDKLVFWNPNDTTTAQLERLRMVAIDRLMDQTYLIDDCYMRLHEEMIARLRDLKVSHVD